MPRALVRQGEPGAQAVLAASSVSLTAPAATTPRFYPDDPIWVDDDTALDASKALGHAGQRTATTSSSTRSAEARRASNVRAHERQHARRSAGLELVHQSHRPARDPDGGIGAGAGSRAAAVSLDGWVISRDKGSGVQPGFRMTDPAGQLYQIEVDPPAIRRWPPAPRSSARRSTTPSAITRSRCISASSIRATRWSSPQQATHSRSATAASAAPFTRRDLDDVLRRAARQPNGSYRVLVSRFAAGRPLGNFRYYGTRPDDPNDIVPHEHRRELRGARVFGAWLNHDDSRGVNSLDMLETRDGRRRDQALHVRLRVDARQRHRLRAARAAPGNEYIFEQRAWMADARDPRPVCAAVDAASTIPDVPNVDRPLRRRRASSRRRGSRSIRIPPSTTCGRTTRSGRRASWRSSTTRRCARSSRRRATRDPKATDYMTQTLIKRRDKVLQHLAERRQSGRRSAAVARRVS